MLAICALAGGIWSLAGWAKIGVARDDVIFTTVAKWATKTSATPTGVRREELQRIEDCCNFYII